MTDKLTVKVVAGERVMEIGGKRFRMSKEVTKKNGHLDSYVFEEIPAKEWDALLRNLAGRLVRKSGLTAEEVVKNALGYMSLDDIRKLDRESRTEKVTIGRGCLYLKVGKREVGIINAV